jgi:hypothetical protein
MNATPFAWEETADARRPPGQDQRPVDSVAAPLPSANRMTRHERKLGAPKTS